MTAANLAVRFLLELAALAALAYWGFRTAGSTLWRTLLGVGAPLVTAVVWGMFVSPRAPLKVPPAVWVGLQVVVFGSAVAALAASGRPALAWVLAVAVVVNSALLALSSR